MVKAVELSDQEATRHSFQEARRVGAEVLAALVEIPGAQVKLEEGLVRAYDNSARDNPWLSGLLQGVLSRPIDVVRRTMEERTQ